MTTDHAPTAAELPEDLVAALEGTGDAMHRWNELPEHTRDGILQWLASSDDDHRARRLQETIAMTRRPHNPWHGQQR